MKIDIIAGKVIGGWEPNDKRLGGTEDSIVQWARILSVRGHMVRVFHSKRDNIVITDQGVEYLPRESYYPNADITINYNSSDIPSVGTTIYVTNETNANTLDLSSYDAVVWPTQWAEEHIPVNNPVRFIVPYGYDETRIYPRPKVAKQCLYASSPDRGLESLNIVWPKVVEAHPDAQLIVTYGGKIDTPNTTCGEFTESEMDNLFNTSDLWLHPANGGELFCISGIKAQAAETIPVYFPTMALKETVKEGVACKDEEDMANNIIDLLNDEVGKKLICHELAKHHYFTWEDSTEALEEILRAISGKI